MVYVKIMKYYLLVKKISISETEILKKEKTDFNVEFGSVENFDDTYLWFAILKS